MRLVTIWGGQRAISTSGPSGCGGVDSDTLLHKGHMIISERTLNV
jgi:hypothetical protein